MQLGAKGTYRTVCRREGHCKHVEEKTNRSSHQAPQAWEPQAQIPLVFGFGFHESLQTAGLNTWNFKSRLGSGRAGRERKLSPCP